MTPEELEQFIRGINASDAVKANIWDAMTTAETPDDLNRRLKKIPIQQSIKADLWDMKAGAALDDGEDLLVDERIEEEQPQGLLDRFNQGAEFGRQVVEGGLRQAATFPARTAGAVLDLAGPRLTPGVADELRQPLQQFNEEVGPRDTTAQQIGAFGTEMAEFAIPGRLGRTAASLAPRAPRIARGLTEGVTSAVVAQAQGADPVGASVTAALTPLIPPTLQRLGRGFRRGAERQMAQALGTTKEALKAIGEKKVVPGMLDRKVKASSLIELQAKAKKMVEQTAKERDEIIKQIPNRSMRGEVLRTFHALDRKKNALKFTDINKIRNVELFDEIVRVENEMMDVYLRSGGNVSFKSLLQSRQLMEDFIENRRGELGLIQVFVKGATTPAIKARQQGSNIIRAELAKSFPDFGRIQSEFHFWKSLETIVSATVERTQPQSRLGPILVGAGFGVGGLVGGSIAGDSLQSGGVGALLAGTAAKNLFEATRSTGWRTVSSNTKNTIAKMLMSGALDEAAELAVRITGANVRPIAGQLSGITSANQ